MHVLLEKRYSVTFSAAGHGTAMNKPSSHGRNHPGFMTGPPKQEACKPTAL